MSQQSQPIAEKEEDSLAPLDLFLYGIGAVHILLGIGGAVFGVLTRPAEPIFVLEVFPLWMIFLVWLILGVGIGVGLIALAVILGRQRLRIERASDARAELSPQRQNSPEPTPVLVPVASPEPTPVAIPVPGVKSKLLTRVEGEAKNFDLEQCKRFHALIQEHAASRDWVEAIKVAHRLIKDFPSSPQADEARTMMPTLVDNGRLQEVRQYREKIQLMVAEHRYAGLVELARYILENYPETTLAEEMREKINIWQQMA